MEGKLGEGPRPEITPPGKARHKGDKAAHRAWERCTPVIPRQKLVLRYGGVEMFTPVKEIDAMGGGN